MYKLFATKVSEAVPNTYYYLARSVPYLKRTQTLLSDENIFRPIYTRAGVNHIFKSYVHFMEHNRCKHYDLGVKIISDFSI